MGGVVVSVEHAEPHRIIDLLGDDRWGPWVPLRGAGRNREVPTTAGLYRIRRQGLEHLDYLGQTGNSLRGRLGMLNGAYAELMPYNDPHTVGPALWATRQSDPHEFEASTLTFDGRTPDRKGLESAAIYLHRMRWGFSPTFSFGRMPDGYRKSSGNSRRLVEAGKRFRGGPDAGVTPSPRSLPPESDHAGSPVDDDWMGHQWSTWASARSPEGIVRSKEVVGLYRIRRSGSTERLVYVGQGSIAKRLRAHARKANDTRNRQSVFFRGSTEVSWVEVPGPVGPQLLELETDLIGAHVLTTGRAPEAQFLG